MNKKSKKNFLFQNLESYLLIVKLKKDLNKCYF